MSAHPSTLDVKTLLDDCEVRRQRRSGPGGQHRNKVETAIFIRHLPTGIEAGASERRSQEQNRSVAVERLRLKLAVEHRRTLSDKYVPSERWLGRLRGGRILVSTNHFDFAALLAEALDVVALEEYVIAKAASRLGCTNSQLIKLLREEGQAWARVKRRRQELGLPQLK